MNFQGSMNDLIGKSILVGFTYFDHNRELKEQKQYLGKITHVDDDVNTIDSEENESVKIPAQQHVILYAPRGEYLCKSSGKSVKDPNFITSWSLLLPEEDEYIDLRFNYAPLFTYEIPREWILKYAVDSKFNEELIEKYGFFCIGKDIIIGMMRYIKKDGVEELLEQTQLYGTIQSANFNKGIVVDLGNEETYALPPDLTMIQQGGPGEYHLRSTGQVVTNPSFITMISSIKDE